MCERAATGAPSIDEVGEAPECFCLLSRDKARAKEGSCLLLRDKKRAKENTYL